MDMNNSPLTIFLDLSKAFDTLNHEILIAKLKHYGLNNSALQLCKNYLTSRKQFTQIQDAQSSHLDINIGLPQGSILGPFLFLVFVNDLPNCTDIFNFITYADGTTLISTINHQVTGDTNSLNFKLNKVYEWLCTNKLSLNVAKTKSVIFHTPQRQIIPPVITINNKHIETVDSFNFLGVTLDKHMTWKAHTNKVIKNSTNHRRPQQLEKHDSTICKTAYLQRTHCSALKLWNPGLGLLTTYQQYPQNPEKSSQSNSKYTDPILKHLGLLKIADIRQLFEIKFYYKFKANLLPQYFSTFITNNESHHTNAHMTRGRHLLSVPAHRHHFFKSGLRYSIVNTINSCPTTILSNCGTHSIKAVSENFKSLKIESYQIECIVENGYVCRGN
jgi:hypothetical protein